MCSAPKQHPEVTQRQSSAALCSRAHLGHACSGSMAMPARKQTFTHAVAARRHAATHACTLLRVCMRRHGPRRRPASGATLPVQRGESCPTLCRSERLYGTGRVCGAGVGQRALLGRLSQGHPYRDGLPRSALSPGVITETTRLAAAVQAGPAHASPRSPSECAATLGSKRAWGDATLCAPARMRPWHWRC